MHNIRALLVFGIITAVLFSACAGSSAPVSSAPPPADSPIPAPTSFPFFHSPSPSPSPSPTIAPTSAPSPTPLASFQVSGTTIEEKAQSIGAYVSKLQPTLYTVQVGIGQDGISFLVVNSKNEDLRVITLGGSSKGQPILGYGITIPKGIQTQQDLTDVTIGINSLLALTASNLLSADPTDFSYILVVVSSPDGMVYSIISRSQLAQEAAKTSPNFVELVNNGIHETTRILVMQDDDPLLENISPSPAPSPASQETSSPAPSISPSQQATP